MYPRIKYEMSEEDLVMILNASEPTPVLFGNNGINLCQNQQENANYAWKKLGKKMGFDYMTVRPIEGSNKRCFTVVPTETESQLKEREVQEIQEKKLKRILELRQEIEIKKHELSELEK